ATCSRASDWDKRMNPSELDGTWDYRTLPANVRLGENCFIERKDSFKRYRSTQPVGLVLGANVTVYTWTEFSVEPSATLMAGHDRRQRLERYRRLYPERRADRQWRAHSRGVRCHARRCVRGNGRRQSGATSRGRAAVSASVQLAHDWYPVPVPANVVLGDRSWLYSSFAFLHFRSQRPAAVRIGRASGIYVGSFFDLGPDGE